VVSGARALHEISFREVPWPAHGAIAASDPDYLRWIVEKSELEEGIKHVPGNPKPLLLCALSGR